MNIPFKNANIMVPKKDIDMTKWSVVACDQYTSELDYWQKLETVVGDSPSTLRITLPEIYLEDNPEERIEKINQTMEKYLNDNIFDEYQDSMIYIERKQKDGRIREGLIGVVDLEDYDYSPNSETLIRATEKTVIERIPPRVKIRENAGLELPHIMILIDDREKKVIEPLKTKVTNSDLLYDFELNMDGGHLKGYLVNKDIQEDINKELANLMNIETFNQKYNVKDKGVLLFAMGDGNHSLATAKACYENLKKEIGDEAKNHKARYALVELVNLHSEALEFEAIHRVIFNTNPENLLNELYKYYKINEQGNGQEVEIVTSNLNKKIYIENPKSNLAIGSMQIFLDEYLKNNAGKIDYIHGDDTTRNMAKSDNNIGFLFKTMQKDELFKSVILDGALPRKTFSMGHAYDKRYYTEARKIK